MSAPAPEQYLGYPVGQEADRERQARKLGRVIELSQYEAVLSPEQDRTIFIDNLSPDDFVSLLGTINGIVTNQPRSMQGMVDQLQYANNKEAGLLIDIMPSPADKIPLLHELLLAAKTCDPQLVAPLLGFGINIIHPYADGNGRTARAVYYLLSRGYTRSDPLLTALLGPDGDDILNMDVNLFMPPLYTMLKAEYGSEDIRSEGGTETAVPLIMPAVKSAMRSIGQRDVTARPFDPTEIGNAICILNHESLQTLVPFKLITAVNAPQSALNAISLQQGSTALFYIDEFLKYAKKEDMTTFFDVFSQVKRDYVRLFIAEFTMSRQPPVKITMLSNEHGAVQGPFAAIGIEFAERRLTTDNDALMKLHSGQ